MRVNGDCWEAQTIVSSSSRRGLSAGAIYLLSYIRFSSEDRGQSDINITLHDVPAVFM